MEHEVVSVIMPVYNVESKKINNHLAVLDGIDSFFKQNIDKELIIINDCSTDNTKTIIEKYIKNRESVYFINLKNNIGPGGCRNVGLREAKGKYIFFLDSDDVIPENSLYNLVRSMGKNQSDYVIGKHKSSKRNVATAPFKFGDIDNMHLNPLVFTSVGPWGKLYRNSIIRKNNIKFPEHLKWFEDFSFLASYISYSEKISVCTKQFFYILRDVDEGEHLTKSYKVNINDFIFALLNIFENINNNKHTNRVKAFVLDRLMKSPKFENFFLNTSEEFYIRIKNILTEELCIEEFYFLIETKKNKKLMELILSDISYEQILIWNKYSNELNDNFITIRDCEDRNIGQLMLSQKLFSMGYLKSELSLPNINIQNNKLQIGVNNTFYSLTLLVLSREFPRQKIIRKEISKEENMIIDIQDLFSKKKVSGEIIDFYYELEYDHILIRNFFPGSQINNGEKISKESKFYINWRKGLSYYIERDN